MIAGFHFLTCNKQNEMKIFKTGNTSTCLQTIQEIFENMAYYKRKCKGYHEEFN